MQAPPEVESRSDRSFERLVRRQCRLVYFIIDFYRQAPGQAR